MATHPQHFLHGSQQPNNPGNYRSLVNSDRMPPQALEIEEAVLGAIMLERDALPNVVDILRPEVFYLPAHQEIYNAMMELFQNSNPIDILTLKNQLQYRGTLEEAGGSAYVTELSSKVASAANIEYHATLLVQKHIKREVINICSKLQREAYQDTTDPLELLDMAEQELYSLSGDNLRREAQSMERLTLQTINHLEELRNREESITGIPTGFATLDEMTSGWQRSDLIIIAARPSMGKTAFMLSVARNAAMLENRPVLLFSLEMGAQQLALRLMCAEAELDNSRVRNGQMEGYEWEQLTDRIGDLSKAPIYIDDTPGLSIYDMRAKCRRFKAEKGIDMIIVDYLQLMQGTGRNNNTNREQEISGISRSLKMLAKELDVPVIALSQLSRKVEDRGSDKRPMLSDLRESGAIEQDADVVMFIYRPEFYNFMTDAEGNSTEGVAEIIVGKHRNGPVGTAQLQFIKQYGKFTDLQPGLESGFSMLQQQSAAPSGGGNTVRLPSKMNDTQDEEDNWPSPGGGDNPGDGPFPF
jgi:replicative DNA helicase